MAGLSHSQQHLLAVLTWALRVATDTQLAAGLRVPGERHAAFGRQLDRLARRGLLRRARIGVAVIDVREPLVAWCPGEPAPDRDAVAWQLERRWHAARPQCVRILWATERAAALVGGVGGRLRQPLQLQHDLGTASVYVRRRSSPGRLERWVGEDAYRAYLAPPRHAKVPDALILDDDGTIRRVIEFGGLYGARRLGAFHRHWSRRRVPYEIW